MPTTTNHHIQDVLPHLLQKIQTSYNDQPIRILQAWPEVIGKKFASMTEALSFQEGVLTIRVKNSTLYSLLVLQENPLRKALQKRFPKTKIQAIRFCVR